MKILLMDLDISNRCRAFPNLALMKLSAYHKTRGDEVVFNFPLCQPDRIYASCVFTWNKKRVEGLSPDVILGGSGINLKAKLPLAVEHIMPDYTLYSNYDFSMGYTTRGCIRNCWFCNVRAKEGYLDDWADIDEFYNPQFGKLILLDNNILPAKSCIHTFKKLIAYQVLTDFNQGLDIRCLDDEKVHYLKQIKVKKYRFAFDDIAYEKQVRQGIDLLLKAGIPPRKLAFYVLVGFQNDETAIDRMKLLASYGVDVYPMIYKGQNGKEPIMKTKWDGTIFWHGNRNTIRKFLRVVGRLE